MSYSRAIITDVPFTFHSFTCGVNVVCVNQDLKLLRQDDEQPVRTRTKTTFITQTALLGYSSFSYSYGRDLGLELKFGLGFYLDIF